MFPLYDESAPTLKTPYLTIFLIFLNVFIFGLTFFSESFNEIVFRYGLIPEKILDGENLKTLVTSMFLHGGFLHLIGNMWFLWIFGDNIENKLGKIKFLIFYLLVGILATLFHIFLISPEQKNLPVIGASGAISGLLGGYLILFPKNRIRAFFLFFFQPIFFYLPAFLYIGIWFLYQLEGVGTPTSIAYLAHIGGFLSGAVLIKLIQRGNKFLRKIR